MTGTYATIVADSISPEEVRITTMEVCFHRFVLAEFNTHRVFSRNSASSRAIPLAKQIRRIRDSLAMPVAFPKEQRGMQGGEALDEETLAQTQSNWHKASQQAVLAASIIGEAGVHKSVVNRLLEPFMWHTVVVTSTAWENFFAQRCSPLAQPEIRVAAEMMQQAYRESVPALTGEGEWHLPYVGDDAETLDILAEDVDKPAPWDIAAKVSAARCARVSYLTQAGKRDPREDLVLYQRLTEAQPAHWSPLEHVATPWPLNRQNGALTWDGEHAISLDHLPRVGNLLGWRSLRTEEEARQEQRTYA